MPEEMNERLQNGNGRVASTKDEAGLRLSRPAFSPLAFLVVVQDTCHHSKAFVFHVRTSLCHLQSEFPGAYFDFG